MTEQPTLCQKSAQRAILTIQLDPARSDAELKSDWTLNIGVFKKTVVYIHIKRQSNMFAVNPESAFKEGWGWMGES